MRTAQIGYVQSGQLTCLVVGESRLERNVENRGCRIMSLTSSSRKRYMYLYVFHTMMPVFATKRFCQCPRCAIVRLHMPWTNPRMAVLRRNPWYLSSILNIFCPSMPKCSKPQHILVLLRGKCSPRVFLFRPRHMLPRLTRYKRCAQKPDPA